MSVEIEIIPEGRACKNCGALMIKMSEHDRVLNDISMRYIRYECLSCGSTEEIIDASAV
jgi:RNase P subunit RPR2